jgi:hypothetical protein
VRSLTPRIASGALAAGLLAAGCASLAARDVSALPLLPPAGFGVEASRSQRLAISRLDEAKAQAPERGSLTLDAVVEVDAEALRVAGFLLGQRVLLLVWDGRHLEEAREPVVPAALRGDAVLRDLQLVYWPAAEIRARLPAGWRLEEDAGRRWLLRDGRVRFESERRDAEPLGAASLVNHAGGIEAAAATAP